MVESLAAVEVIVVMAVEVLETVPVVAVAVSFSFEILVGFP